MTEVAFNGNIVASESSPLQNNAITEQTPPGDDPEDNGGEIRCICGFTEDDGFTIQCDKCDTWQHGACLNIGAKDVPDNYVCHFCSGREVDTKRARETQRKRMGQETRSHKKKSNTTSHRRKEPSEKSHHRGASEQITDRSRDGKPSSPKDPSSKPRSKQRNNVNHVLPDTTFSPNQQHSPSENSTGAEGDIDSDSEVPSSVYTKDYITIHRNSSINTKTNELLKSWLTECKFPKDGRSPHHYGPSMRTTREGFAQMVSPQISVRRVSGSTQTQTIGAPQNYLAVETSAEPGSFVLDFRGEIGLQQEYIDDATNQYSLIRHPKQFVVFHPDLPYYVDARWSGSESRFVRRSCKPNLALKTILVDDTDVHFAFFAMEKLETGAELTIGWEWDSSVPIHQASSLTPVEFTKLSKWVEVLLSSLGECACTDKSLCLLEKFRESKPSKHTTKSRMTNKINGKRRRQDTSKVTTDDPTEATDFQGRRRSSSTSSHRKSSSRDQTPINFTDINAANAGLGPSARETRKMQQAVTLMEKMNNDEAQSNRKRVKRPGAGAVSLSAPMPAKPADERHSLPFSRTTTEERDTVSPVELHRVDDNVYHTSVPARVQSNPSNLLNGTSRCSSVLKPTYRDSATQTSREDLPTLFVKGVLSRKKRILASWRLQQEQKNQKLALQAVKEESSPIVLNLGGEDTEMMDFKPKGENLTPVDPNIVKASPQGTQDSLRQYDHLNGAGNYLKTAFPATPTVTSLNKVSSLSLNGYRSAEMHVAMPSTPMFPNAPSTPAITGGPSSSISGNLLQSPPALSVMSTMPLEHGQPSITEPLRENALSQAAPTPAKKKLSLSEYGKRKKAAETTEKERLAAVALPEEESSAPITKTINLEKPVSDGFEAPFDLVPTKDTVPMDVDIPAAIAPLAIEIPVSKEEEMHDV